MTTVSDQTQREQALDIARSFIVHAPAGSGKTELLVQRYLKLLSHSPYPETVVAITFTRKAAKEMKTRVLESLQNQHAIGDIQATHLKKRAILANNVNRWQAKKGWDLIKEPHRLRILTIDAFYTQLLEKTKNQNVLNLSITEQPHADYQQAVKKLFSHLEDNTFLKEAVSKLLYYLNNDLSQTETLLIQMLAQRDQWLWILEEYSQDINQFRKVLESNIQHICQMTCQDVESVFLSHHETTDWKTLLQQIYAAHHPKAPFNTFEFWRFVANALLTQEGKWRHNITRLLEKLTALKYKEQFTIFFRELTQKESCRIALIDVKKLPNHYYTQPQWEWLISLLQVLKSLVVILEDVFEDRHHMDHTEVGLRALHALGKEDRPSELLLQLDQNIQHILIDEFQDTSLQQIRFLKKLIEGWQPDDGRTIFLVGDPMQSIYRFRKAEARLFEVIKQTGLGARALVSLTLSTNFRASSSLIQWTNQTFHDINQFLKKVSQHVNPFTASLPVLNQSNPPQTTSVYYYWFSDTDRVQEYAQIITLIKNNLEVHATKHASSKSPSIAILGRTRQSLLKVVHTLRASKIPHTAIEIEVLSDKPIIQDLLALTRALNHLADDTAWLAVLRAPWCGASLKELHTLVQSTLQTRPRALLWEQLQQLDKFQFHANTLKRLQRVVHVLEPVIANYGRVKLEHRVKQAWFYLGGFATQPEDSADSSSDTDAFFQCLEKAQISEIEVNISALEALLDTTYSPSTHSDTTVTVMTIHKAKGLEFDTVILTGLHHKVRSDVFPLLLCEIIPAHRSEKVLLAPIKSAASKHHDPLYQFLWDKNQRHNQAETIRLLYVACTRAKTSLHLLGTLEKDSNATYKLPTGSFLQWLWPTLTTEQKAFMPEPALEKRDNAKVENTRPLFYRMSLSSAFPKAPLLETSPTMPWQSLESSQKPHSHEAMVRVIRNFLNRKSVLTVLNTSMAEFKTRYQNAIKNELTQQGLYTTVLEESLHQVITTLKNFKKSSKLYWILQEDHEDVRIALRFGVIQGNSILEHYVDRTFCDDSTQQRWVIYYLFSNTPDASHVTFREILSSKKYHNILNTTLAFSKLTMNSPVLPIHIGLYWPLADVLKTQSLLELEN